MTLSCSDVCDEVMAKLHQLGFRFTDDEDHSDILDALDRVHLVLDDGQQPRDYNTQQSDDHPPADCPHDGVCFSTGPWFSCPRYPCETVAAAPAAG